MGLVDFYEKVAHSTRYKGKVAAKYIQYKLLYTKREILEINGNDITMR